MSQVTDRSQIINVGKSRFEDPANFSGLCISEFSLHQTYRVNSKDTQRITEALYETAVKYLDSGNLLDFRYRLNTYREKSFASAQDNENEQNKGRTYLLITRDTVRETRTTILVRFLAHGDNLYVGIDTYILGPLNFTALIRKVLLTVIVPFFILVPIPLVGSLLFLFWPALVTMFWWGCIQNAKQTGDWKTAFRLEFSRTLHVGSFNLDDIFMFSQSSLNSIIDSIREVFNKEELSTEGLDSFTRRINRLPISTEVSSADALVRFFKK